MISKRTKDLFCHTQLDAPLITSSFKYYFKVFVRYNYAIKSNLIVQSLNVQNYQDYFLNYNNNDLNFFEVTNEY
jgi:hypothetical protein